jgi:hypothetical protein
MRLSSDSVGLEAEERVTAHYTPPKVARYSWGEEFQHQELVRVWIGDLAVSGPPAVVVELLGQALRKTCGVGRREPGRSGRSPVGSGGGDRRSTRSVY